MPRASITGVFLLKPQEAPDSLTLAFRWEGDISQARARLAGVPDDALVVMEWSNARIETSAAQARAWLEEPS